MDLHRVAQGDAGLCLLSTIPPDTSAAEHPPAPVIQV